MMTDAQPEVVRSATRSLDRLIRRHAATEGATGDVESFAVLARTLAVMLRGFWDEFLAQLKGGMDGEEVRTKGASLAIAADNWYELAQVLQEVAEQLAQQVGEPIKGLSELANEAMKIREIGLAARKVVDSVNATWNFPLEQEILDRSEADFSAGRVRKGKEVIARLRS